jgi:hypothetical protein
MRALVQLSVLFVLLSTSLLLHADVLPESILPDSGTIDSSNAGQTSEVFLETALVLDTAAEPTSWMLAPSSTGASSCDFDENAGCLTPAELISRRLAQSEEVTQDDPIRNNLPEPATWIMIAGAAPLLWGRLKTFAR